MKRIRLLTLSILLVGLPSLLQGQIESPVVIPPSPNAASLAKFIEFPVGLYTGIPSINIPIWTLSGRELSVPISLSYHAGGVRVEENATSVGLGWALNAGGMVSRSVRGLPDEGNGGYLIHGLSDPIATDFFAQVLNNAADSGPDSYSFSFNGYSGSFTFDQNGVPHIDPYQELKIAYTTGSGVNGISFTTFTITTPDGTQYIFGENDAREVTRTETYNWSVPAGSALSNPNHHLLESQRVDASYTSWYLTTIIAPSKTESFSFSYLPDSYQYMDAKKGTFGYTAAQEVEFRKIAQTEYRILGRRLDEISCNSNGLSVTFEAAKNRTDVQDATGVAEGPKAYTKIIINDIEGNPDRVFRLNTDYFRNPLLDDPGSGILANEEYQYQRLKLVSVQEYSGDESKFLNPYVFTYEESIPLPPKDAHKQDHWGYYNGPLTPPSTSAEYYSNYYMVPPYEGGVDNGPLFAYVANNSSSEVFPLDDVQFIDKNGDNRSPAFPAMRAGVLTQITYPTKGTTLFSYEPHEYGFVGQIDHEDTVYQTEEPLAEVDRPWNEPDAWDEEVVQYGPFPVGEDLTVEVQYEVMYSYEDATQFADGRSYTHNMVELYQVGVSTPIVKVYYVPDINQGLIVEEQAGQITVLTPIDQGNDDSDFSPNGITAAVTGSFFQQLEAGESYYLKATRAQSFVNGVNVRNNTRAWIQMVQSVPTDQIANIIHDFEAGGLRLAHKTDNPGNGGTPIEEAYTYHMFDDNGNDLGSSSGCLVALPEHFRSTYFYQEQSNPVTVSYWDLLKGFIRFNLGKKPLSGGGLEISGYTYLVFEMGANHPVALGTTQGNHLGYRMVKVAKPGNGFSIYRHTSAFDYPDELPDKLKWVTWLDFGSVQTSPHEWGEYDVAQDIPKFYSPFLPKTSHDWKRGLLLQTDIFDENVTRRSQEKQFYSFQQMGSVTGYQTIFSDIRKKYLNLTLTSAPWVEYIEREFHSGWVKHTQTVSKLYNPTGTESVTTTTHNYYEGLGHTQLTRSQTSNSDGRITESRIKFPPDYDPSLSLGPNSSLTVQQLVDANMITLPIESQTWEGTGSSLALTGANLLSYKDFNESGNGEPNIRSFETFIVETNSPLALNESKNAQGQFTSIIPSPNHYVLRAEVSYEDQGPVAQFERKPGMITSYVWDKNSSIPTAQVVNAEAEAIAYTSFEESDQSVTGGWIISGQSGGWNTPFAKTGKRSFELTSGRSLSASASPNGTYILSYWVKGSNPVLNVSSTLTRTSAPDSKGFVYHEYEITLGSNGSISLNGNGTNVSLDELRLYPTDAQMNTVCYDEHLRIHTMTDANNQSVYYTYDEFGRLIEVRDFEGNLLNVNKYHYAN